MELEIGTVIKEFKNSVMGRLDSVEAENREWKSLVEAEFIKLNRPGTGGDNGNNEHKEAFFGYMRSGRESDLQQKAMTSGTSPEGGYLVPEEVDTLLTKYLRARSPMRQLARVMTATSSEFKEPHSTLGTSYQWVGETTGRTETTAPAFKMVTIPTCEIYAMPLITQQLLDDNAFDLGNWLVTELGDAFGDGEADAFINGNGVARPRGLFTYDTVATADATRASDKFQYIPTGGAGAFAASNPSDALIQLVYSVKSQYRQNASWLMSPECLEAIRKFKTASTNEYLWQPSTQAGQPATLLGYPVYEDENLPAIAANSLSLAFGDFKRSYTITDRSTALLRDPYSQKPYVAYYATKRLGGGGGRDTRAVKFLKFAAS